ncbi:hypothetical protein Tco_0626850 [Tanacetum coccineum]|uniref:Uncharacterized protein n=1 Tax=Tanacetum coccineum TaxID=301880 RepID=A0ABQ4WKU1_9ASTR
MKKQKLEDDSEKEDLKAYLDIIPGDDVAIDIESLAIKYPIVDWKTHVLIENFTYYQIIRADRGSKNYKIFSEMLEYFDRQDVMDLHRLVKERHQQEIQFDNWRDYLFLVEFIILLMDNGISHHDDDREEVTSTEVEECLEESSTVQSRRLNTEET